MKRILGICNLHDGPSLGELTKERPLGATTFLGRYGLMDFVLSNFSNSKIDRVDILVEENFQSIKNHVKDGSVWVNNTKTGFQKLYFNEKLLNNKKLNTDVANIVKNKICSKENGDLIVVAPAFFITRIDYRDFIEKHIQSGNDISVIYSHQEKPSERFLNCDSILIGKDGQIEKFSIVREDAPEGDVSLEMFIINTNVFNELISKSGTISALMPFRKLIPYALSHQLFKVGALEHKGYVVPILSFESFVKESFDLLHFKNRQLIFNDEWPIYTTTHNTPPTLYGDNAKVSNSFIANGSIINGTVENSIISRDVKIDEGAVVKNCILYTRTHVHSGVHLENVVCDKRCNFKEMKEVKGTADEPLYIPFGETI